eukprot:TRINITY_DN66785_c5_g2_i1.p1 TRINITY_DN66785_c5_g2~~TRINITY_DN66785_c5_g2_i1.p1  ORF type:complete len:154 (-),score=18.74 TRINITY_DN66785_c5_g2_i1:137-598(-)
MEVSEDDPILDEGGVCSHFRILSATCCCNVFGFIMIFCMWRREFRAYSAKLAALYGLVGSFVVGLTFLILFQTMLCTPVSQEMKLDTQQTNGVEAEGGATAITHKVGTFQIGCVATGSTILGSLALCAGLIASVYATCHCSKQYNSKYSLLPS